MSRNARLVARQCATSDRRVICWWECEFLDDEGIRRDRDHAFFSLNGARAWVRALGYDPIDPASGPVSAAKTAVAS